MAELCRHDAFVIVNSQLDGSDYAVDVCDEPATHLVCVRRSGDGLAVEIAVRVCAAHERVVGGVDGYVRSIKLRAAVAT